jgi:hypothetical protein
MRQQATMVWMGAAAAATACLAAVTLAVLGANDKGINIALLVTARFCFLIFWFAYAGGALAALFGPRFQSFRQNGRLFGLAFAAALCVHLALVAWLCLLGDPPARGTFIVFGIAVACTFILVLLSVRPLQRAVGPTAWWALRLVGMNYIAFVFAWDFFRANPFASVKQFAKYMPFDVLSAVAAALLLAALLRPTPQR